MMTLKPIAKSFAVIRGAILAGLFAGALSVASAEATAPAAADATSATAAWTGPGEKLRVLTANILLDSPAYEGSTTASWDVRRDYTFKVMESVKPDIICTQEVLKRQADDMQKHFADYELFGFVGPFMDAHTTGYHGVTKNVLLYRKDRFEFVSAGTYWLSETPLVAGSVSWDCLRGRHANWLRLRDRKSGHEFRIIDTHFDHKGKQGRVEQAKILNAESSQYLPEFPQIMAGDFNADQKNPAIEELKNGGWTDTYAAIHGPEDPGFTFHGMEGEEHKSKSGKIDFIFCRGNVRPLGSEIVKDHEGKRYPSDHYFLWADLEL